MLKRIILIAAAALLLFTAASAAEEAKAPETILLADGASVSNAEGAVVDGDTVRILKAGEYMLSGSLSNGQIRVECDRDSKVKLYLNGVRIHNETGPAVYVSKGMSRVSISLLEGVENELSDGEHLVFTEKEKEPNGVIFSRSDLTITGDGVLTVRAGDKDGIVSKDDLRIKGGAISVNARRHGIRGKDYVQISNATVTVVAGKDALRSTADDREDRGYIEITDSTLDITCGDDAFSYVTRLTVRQSAVNCLQGEETED